MMNFTLDRYYQKLNSNIRKKNITAYTDLIAELQAEIKVTQRQIDSVAGVNSNTFEVYDPSNTSDTITFTGTGANLFMHFGRLGSNNPSVDSGSKYEVRQH